MKTDEDGRKHVDNNMTDDIINDPDNFLTTFLFLGIKR